jgi:hypothetical protein
MNKASLPKVMKEPAVSTKSRVCSGKALPCVSRRPEFRQRSLPKRPWLMFEGIECDDAKRIVELMSRTRLGSMSQAANKGRAEHIRSAHEVQTSTCSAIASASSTSIPR